MSPASPAVTMPQQVFETLRTGFVENSADWLIRGISRGDRRPLLHLGDPFGRVLAWLWETDTDAAMLVLGDYLATLRNHHPLSGNITPPVSLDEVLRALRPALPDGFDDYQALVVKARQEVPIYYGDPNV